MMSFAILILSIATFIAGIRFQLAEISVLALQIFSAFVVSCLVDTFFGLISLKRAVNGTYRSSSRHPLTWIGRQFASYQEAISYRISSLSDQVAHYAMQVDVVSPEPTVDTQESFFEQILNELDIAFKPSNCVLMVANKDYNTQKCYIKGTRGKRLEENFKKLFSDWFFAGSTKWLGLHDTLHHDFPSDELAAFGIRYIVSAKIDNTDYKGILLLGFNSEKEPSKLVKSRLEDYSKKLERELGTFNNFQLLKSRVDQAEKISEARSEFLTHVSHDIKSPLNNVKAILALLREDFSNLPDSALLMDTALRNCESVAELVNSLIDFAMHRSGKLIANKSLFNLNEIVSDIVQAFEPAARAKGLKLSFENTIFESKCFADKIHTRRIISNLISNSIKYCDAGAVNILINPKDYLTWSLRIQDTGPGFKAEQLKEIFAPFTRFDTQGIEGVGLGLAVSKILAELNGGSLSVHSEYGYGAEFTIDIPSSTAQEAALNPEQNDKIIDFSSTQQHAALQKNCDRLQGLKLLIVDDDPDSTQSLSKILAKDGADIAQANTVPDAMSIINFDSPDVLITDANMPEGGGRKLIKFMRINAPNAAVIVITGDVSSSDELIALGASCVMDKPVHISELLDYLEDIFDNTQKQQAVGT